MGCTLSKSNTDTNTNINTNTNTNTNTKSNDSNANYLNIMNQSLTSLKTNFRTCTYEQTTEFNKMLKDKILTGRVVDIYDGDTITCVINIFGNNLLVNIRLGDIDTCEMKSKNEKAKDLAYKARRRMYQLITKMNDGDKYDIGLKTARKDVRSFLQLDVYLVNILCGELDKYGRLLGWIFDISDKTCYKSNSYNHTLIREKLAYEYEGNTKLTELEQIDLLSD
jgi:endonuclease YncB( thermonuclease family)